jgi:hypothetical protein
VENGRRLRSEYTQTCRWRARGRDTRLLAGYLRRVSILPSNGMSFGVTAGWRTRYGAVFAL